MPENCGIGKYCIPLGLPIITESHRRRIVCFLFPVEREEEGRGDMEKRGEQQKKGARIAVPNRAWGKKPGPLSSGLHTEWDNLRAFIMMRPFF